MPALPRLDLSTIQTENLNPLSTHIDKVSTIELCTIINTEDTTVPKTITACIPDIARAIDAFTERVQLGGRIFYLGAGTSGRLGVLDASEIPPTFSLSPDVFVGLIAGGDVALRSAVEGAEDDAEVAVQDLKVRKLDGRVDCVIGIAASGRTPYVLGGLQYARALGCRTAGIACSAPSAMSESGDVEFMVNVVTGPEVVTGSTRMKAGTATKLVLNMISTGIMVKIGKTYGNVMVDVRPTNVKLKYRARRILRQICSQRCPVEDEVLDKILEACEGSVKLAAVAICLDLPVRDARKRLDAAGGVLAEALRAETLRSTDQALAESRKFYLCIDAGGSKCAAVIQSIHASSHGLAGPCNLTEIEVSAAVAKIMHAVRDAVDAHPEKDFIDAFGFTNVWIAIAGVDRADLKSTVHDSLVERLKLTPGGSLRVTNDVELLVALASDNHGVRNSIVLIAGTGSVSMTYQRHGNTFVQTDRSGGFGATLGDDGSGFDIGKRAICSALQELESRARDPDVRHDICQLTRLVLEHYGIACDASSQDLLGSVLMPDYNIVSTPSDSKRRIATCAKVVLAASDTCKEAEDIISLAVASLSKLVINLLQNPSVLPEETVLIMSGGLLRAPSFRGAVQRCLDAAHITFCEVTSIISPAEFGAKYLAGRR